MGSLDLMSVTLVEYMQVNCSDKKKFYLQWIMVLRKGGLARAIKGELNRWNAGGCAGSDVCLSPKCYRLGCVDGLSVTCGRATATVGNSVEILALASTIREEDRYRLSISNKSKSKEKNGNQQRTQSSNCLKGKDCSRKGGGSWERSK